MTPTNQTPSECKHCTICGNPPTPICSILYWNGVWGSDAACKLYRGAETCPDYQPKEKKDNGKSNN